jgi:DNA-binding response OmpR family regulator
MRNKLLIIDDKPSHSEFLKWILSVEHYEIYTASKFGEAKNLLADCSFDLILLDLIMPDADGFEMLNYLSSHDRLRRIPVIIVSAKSDRESIEASLRKGAVDYVVKPYNSWDLQNKIAIILETNISYKKEKE